MALSKVNPNFVNQNNGRRRMNINGDMSVWQRGTSFTGLSSGNPLSADRMHFKITSSGTWTLTRESDAPAGTGFTYSLKALCTSADSSANQLRLYHNFEGQDVTQLAYGTSSAKSLAVSFWVKSNVTGTYSSSLESHITGRQASLNFTVDSAGTWEKKELIFGGDSASAITATTISGLTMSIWLGSIASLGTGGTTNGQWVTDSSYTRLNGGGNVYLGDTANNYLQITGLQIESGDTATDFEHRSYAEELAACQRYYETSYVTGVAPGTAPAAGQVYASNHNSTSYPSSGELRFTTRKRATPTIVLYNSQTGTVNSVYGQDNGVNTAISSVNGINENGIGVFYASGGGFGTVGYRYTYHYTADAEL
tara:strand:- start:133 stop:1230 length:1098 start_codon:yes stop_codon:yes gene_type:complete